MDMIMFEPLCITAYLESSIGVSRPEDVSLDGILAHEVLRKHFGYSFYSLPDPKEVLYFARLPLEMRGLPSERVQELQTGALWIDQAHQDISPWYWSCSRTQLQIRSRATQYWNKQIAESMTDSIDFKGRRGKIIIEQGQFKSYHMPLAKLIAARAWWYVYGDKEQLATLLLPVIAIGKKTAQGQGHVLRWTIEPTLEDYSEWKDGKLMRPLPVIGNWQEVTPLDMQYVAFRAPQWHPANQQMCVVAGVKHG
jgi:CRISPR type IV-associated protein Csf3